MPKSGETRAVKQVKEAMAKAKTKQAKPVDKPSIHNPQVVQLDGHQESSIHNLEVVPNHNLEVVLTTGIEHKEKNIDKVVLHNLEVSDFDSLIDLGLKPEQIADSLETLLPLYRAEGIEPTSSVLAVGIRQLQADAR